MTAGYLVAANPEAGSTDADTVEQVVARLERDGPVTRVVPSEDALDDALLNCDGDVVVVIGGDGSMHHVAQRLHALDRLDLEVGLVPLGTGNDLARGAGLPLTPEEAAEGLTHWRPHPIDLLVSDGRLVVNAVHLGLGAEAAQAAGRWKRRLGTLAYPLGAVVAGTWVPPWHLRVTVDGKVLHEGTTVLAGVGNGATIGGGTRMFPRARLDDGRAEVIVASSRYGRAGRAAFGWALREGRPHRVPWVRTARGRHIEVSGEAVAGNADGELWEAAAEWRIEVVPRAMRLRRP